MFIDKELWVITSKHGLTVFGKVKVKKHMKKCSEPGLNVLMIIKLKTWLIFIKKFMKPSEPIQQEFKLLKKELNQKHPELINGVNVSLWELEKNTEEIED